MRPRGVHIHAELVEGVGLGVVCLVALETLGSLKI